MSTDTTHGEADVRQLLATDFEPHTGSRQALYHEHDGRPEFDDPWLAQHHSDSESLYQHLGLTPFWKVLEDHRQRNHPIFRFPEAYLAAIIHTDDDDIWALEAHDYDYFENEPKPRRKVMEWLIEYDQDRARGEPDIIGALEDGGRDIHGHSRPGRGKTSFVNMIGVGRNSEINNDTILWQLMADESGTIDEVELLPVAPYTTVLAPEGVEIEVRAKPADYRLPEVNIELSDVFRDVVYYSSPEDVWEQVVPGGIYAKLPDPYFRDCERITASAYNTPWDVDSSNEVTPLRDVIFADLKVRAKFDTFLYRTTMIVDEFGDLLPKNPTADASDTHRKVTNWPGTYGKARKKNFSLMAMSHSLKRVHEDVLEKERWFMTFPRTATPRSMAGLRDIPLPRGYTQSMEKGEAAIWAPPDRYAPIKWGNPYRLYGFNGEINISFPEWQEAMKNV